MYFAAPPRPIDESRIFSEDVDELVNMSFPDNEYRHPGFARYGILSRSFGPFSWYYTPDSEEISELEKWKYIAYCNLYWKEQYKFWHKMDKYKEFKEYLKENGELIPEFKKALERLEKKETYIHKEYLKNGTEESNYNH